MRSYSLNICPCCGAKITVDLRVESCRDCGAFAVGPPLAQPDFVLPSYGRALAVGMGGAVLLIALLGGAVAALFERQPFSLEFWNVVAAAETAAWRLKWLALPLSLAALWAGRRVCLKVAREPARFAGLRMARAGFVMSTVVAVGITALIGVTVPARLHQRELAAQAAKNVVGYEVSQVLLEYQTQFASLPGAAEDLDKLPDRDGSVARVAALMESGRYEPEAAIAAIPKANAKPRGRRGSAVKTQLISSRDQIDNVSPEGLSFTNYKLVLPGADKKLGTEDDITLKDGIIMPNAPPALRNTLRPTTANNIAP
ncbi:MAG: hypothetical protein M3407_12880 [Acidobacteriota bacterium]|nr:hypothetical protein [Acidobacteriota bacterium]